MPDQEKELIEALRGLGWHRQLDSISVGTVRTKCPGIISDEKAQEILHDLVQRGLLSQEIEPGGQLATSKPMLIAKSSGFQSSHYRTSTPRDNSGAA
jgi:hypothetical protein